MKNALRPSKKTFIAYLLPVTLIYCFIVIVPIFYSVFYSFFQWKGGPKKIFIGLDNYVRLLGDSVFWQSLQNNLYLVVVCIIGQIGIAFIFALLLNSRLVKMKSVHRTLCYFPVTLAPVVIGFIWSLIYDYNFGLLNFLLKAVGQENACQAWLSNSEIVMGLVSIPIVWQYIGYYVVIFLSAIASIDQGIFEMSEIDGANALQRTLYIALPMLKNTIITTIILCISGNMKTFDHIYSMTGGGPGNASNVMALYAYNTSFNRNNLGYGSAVSVGILFFSLLLILGTKWLAGRLSDPEGD